MIKLNNIVLITLVNEVEVLVRHVPTLTKMFLTISIIIRSVSNGPLGEKSSLGDVSSDICSAKEIISIGTSAGVKGVGVFS